MMWARSVRVLKVGSWSLTHSSLTSTGFSGELPGVACGGGTCCCLRTMLVMGLGWVVQ